MTVPDFRDLTNFQNKYYLKTHTRASPWFVGALIGYFIANLKFENKRNIKFNKVRVRELQLKLEFKPIHCSQYL